MTPASTNARHLDLAELLDEGREAYELALSLARN